MDVTMPQLGETVTEGTITHWFKQVGEPVAADEPLFEVSTDKVDSEVPAPAAGVVSEILVRRRRHGPGRRAARGHLATRRRVPPVRPTAPAAAAPEPEPAAAAARTGTRAAPAPSSPPARRAPAPPRAAGARSCSGHRGVRTAERRASRRRSCAA